MIDSIGAAGATLKLDSQADVDKAAFSNDIDDFLTIFIAQLQNQDPLEPQDSSEFTNQVANLSGVEQAINTNKRLEELINLTTLKDNNEIVSFIGKDVEIESQVVTLEEGKNVNVAYELEDTTGVENVFVTIQDINNNPVFNGAGTSKVGRNTVAWDGTNNQGEIVSPGLYQVFVTTSKGDGVIEAVDTTVRGRVIGANLQAEEPTIIVNGTEIPLGEVKFVGEAV